MRDRTRSAATAGCVLALVALVVVLGVLNPPQRPPVATDRLGPDSGEPVAQYLDRAAAGLADLDTGTATAEHWALVSLTTERTAPDAYRLAAGVRVSELLFRVPLDRVQTPLVVVGVAGERSAARAAAVAAGRMQGSAGEWDRQAQIDAVSAARLSADCACVVGLTVRGDPASLRALAATPGVRSVEALPADAVFGRFAVVPLLPGQTETVAPGPDDGEVPRR
ncbi:hypothetical protein [Rhodococcus tukisamuensis]|uniref:Uncharacterized protein n=1 Tax=Rhodococcus tukisamuensis TaxID=168276 RepID=A0A1G7BGS6_9NOCA|nr:hypothetical protein [Rhodococcus tukisamuensis]SDE25950.1 hypothetical protein SAMN05444580_11325 [Rhodococcus tukisamuensis]